MDVTLTMLVLEATHVDGQPVLRVSVSVLDAEDNQPPHAGQPLVLFFVTFFESVYFVMQVSSDLNDQKRTVSRFRILISRDAGVGFGC